MTDTAIVLALGFSAALALFLLWQGGTMRADQRHTEKRNDDLVIENRDLRRQIDDLKYTPRHSHLEVEWIENQSAIFTRALYENRTAYELIAEAIQRMGICDEQLIKGRQQTAEMRQKPNGGTK